MKIIFMKKSILYYIFFTILVVFLMLSVFMFFNVNNSYSLATQINTNSFFNIDISSTLDTITEFNDKKAYLTFDDGPTTKATSKILDILKSENVKATFFVVGKHVKEYPELVKREYEEGHYIANHGYNHNNKLLYKDMESFRNEIVNTDLEISNAIGIDNYCSHIFRFPNRLYVSYYSNEKKSALKVLSDLNYVYVDWNCLNRDSEKKYSNEQLLNNLRKTSKGKNTLIILMHDTADVNKTYNVLRDSILYLKFQGYEFRNFYDFINSK